MNSNVMANKAIKKLAIALGAAGENLVQKALMEDGWKVTRSENTFDTEKDMVAIKNGKDILVEVKTQVPWVTQNAVTVKPDQIKKCLNVDCLVFVTIPPTGRPNYMYGGWMLKVDPKNMQYKMVEAKGGRMMAVIPIDQPAVELWKKIPSRDLADIKHLTVSSY